MTQRIFVRADYRPGADFVLVIERRTWLQDFFQWRSQFFPSSPHRFAIGLWAKQNIERRAGRAKLRKRRLDVLPHVAKHIESQKRQHLAFFKVQLGSLRA